MSGPKTISIVSFDNDLKIIFFKQNEIKELVSQIKKIKINYPNAQIDIDGNKEISSIATAIEESLKNFSIKTNIYSLSEAEIQARQKIRNKNQELDILISKLNDILINLENKKNDYNSYKEYIRLHENNKLSFDQFKKTTLKYYKKILQEKFPKELSDTSNQIKKIQYELTPKKFYWGFDNDANKRKKDLMEYLAQLEQKINLIKLNISNKIIELSGEINIYNVKDTEINEWTKKIEEKIQECEIDIYKKNFLKKINKLKKSNTLKNIYYYKELFNEINLFISNHKNKIALIGIMNEIKNTKLHKDLAPKVSLIINNIKNVLKKSRIGNSEVKIYKEHLQKLLTENKELKKIEQIKLKEKAFIKKQLIETLKALDYEPVFDMQVIDFEKNNDFLLKIPLQENYINIIITDDGRINYNFQIPENPQVLSVDEKDKKVKEMQISCDLFYQSLEYLKKIGLNIKVKHSAPVKSESLMSFTKKTRSILKDKTLKKQKQVHQKNQIKKRYLK